MNEEKNKHKVHYDINDPEVFSDLFSNLDKDHKKYKITPEEIENIKRMSTLIGDSFVVRINKDSYLRVLLGSTYKELNGSSMERMMFRTPCVNESSVEDLAKLSIDIHRDGVDKNLRGMDTHHMYIDDFYYNLPKSPETDIVTIIQSVDYDRLKKIIDVRRHFHYYEDYRLYRYFEEEEERNNDSLIGKIHYSDSVSDCVGMLSARYNKAASALRSRKRHRK